MTTIVFVCGTRAVVKDGTKFRVVCATCGGGGSTPYATRGAAVDAAIKQSPQPCRCKGCGAR